jgi:hypothetical protein
MVRVVGGGAGTEAVGVAEPRDEIVVGDVRRLHLVGRLELEVGLANWEDDQARALLCPWLVGRPKVEVHTSFLVESLEVRCLVASDLVDIFQSLVGLVQSRVYQNLGR